MALFLDVYSLSQAATDDALEHIFKAHHDNDGGIWKKHESPLLQRMVELFTQRGLTRLEHVKQQIIEWESGAHYHDSTKPVPRPGMMERWGKDELGLVRLYLESLYPGEWTLEDHMLAIEHTIQRYLPADELRTEAEWLATKANMMGKVQANMEQEATLKQADKLLAALPSTVAAATEAFTLSAVQTMALQYGAARCAENVRALTDDVRHKLRQTIMQHTEEKALGIAGESLETRLFDQFAQHNRDWRRIAVTESGECQLQGYIASVKPGTQVKRVEQYNNACNFCRKIDGRIATVVSADHPDKDGETMIWTGKTNVGRSASPKKRVGDVLVPRDESEMYWLPAGVAHPHCFTSPQVPIYTVDGWRRIIDIKEGDLVLTHNGRFRPVNWVLNDAYHTGDVVKIRASFEGKNAFDIADMTPEHPVLTDRGWVPAGEIAAGDKVQALAKVCPTCGKAFVNSKHQTNHCSTQCTPKSGKNQFTGKSGDDYLLEVARTSDANRRRMRNMTIEQRRELTSGARLVAAEKGFCWLREAGLSRKSGIAAAACNYTPSPVEQDIAEMIDVLGFDVELQHRIPQTEKDIRGQQRYWWADIALVEQKIVVEIDGEPWHGRLMHEGRAQRRDADLEAQGWTVMRFDSVKAKQNPYDVVESVCRLAMNHSGEYRFAFVDVVSVEHKSVKKKKLYNFGVEEDESYVIGRGIVVHNCRGRWVPTIEDAPGEDAEFGAWLRATLA